MAARYHPGRYTSAPVTERQKAGEMMKKINEAYNILKK
jgi:curved DNA-binding protein CbpA